MTREEELEYKISHAYQRGDGSWMTLDELVERYKILVCDYKPTKEKDHADSTKDDSGIPNST